MRLLDANVLIYARSTDAPQFATASRWLDSQLSGHERVGLPWESLLAFIRILSNPRATHRPEPVAALWGQVEQWLSSPSAWVPLATDRHQHVLAGLIPAPASHRDVHDAHLATLAIEHGLILCTADRGFARFPGLRWENPLEGRG